MRMHAIKSRFTFVSAAGVIGVSAAAFMASIPPASASSFVSVQGVGGPGGTQEEFTCAHATHVLNVGGVVAVFNGCGDRVELYQYQNETGWSYCISPNSNVSISGKYTDATLALVTTTTSAC
jgi:hypothetical protein